MRTLTLTTFGGSATTSFTVLPAVTGLRTVTLTTAGGVATTDFTVTIATGPASGGGDFRIFQTIPSVRSQDDLLLLSSGGSTPPPPTSSGDSRAFQVLPTVRTQDDLLILSSGGTVPPPTLSVTCPVFTTSIVAGTPMTPVAITATGGTPPYSFSCTGLPSGIACSSTGIISGTPTVSGGFSYNITVTDAVSSTASASCSITVLTASIPLSVTCPVFSTSIIRGLPMTPVAITATGGLAPYSFTCSGLPAGITCSSSGVISGTPTVAGGFLYGIAVRDATSATATVNCSIPVVPPPALSVTCPVFTTTLVAAQPMVPVAITASGGIPPYSFSCTGLPLGVTCSAAGIISGTPTVIGGFNYSITVTDSATTTTNVNCSITVLPTPMAASCPLIRPTVGVPLEPVSMTVTGGIPPYTFSAVGLPPNLTMSSAGVITGTGLTEQAFSYTTTIIDSIGEQIIVTCSGLILPVSRIVLEPVYYNLLWRDDERLLTAADQSWSVDAGKPEVYSIMAPPPLELQLAPPPLANGQLELLTVDSVTLDPATAATILPIPDDLTPAIIWGALADLFGNDGIARDPIRAEYCEQRYQQYVAMARIIPVIIHAELNGVPLIPTSIQEEDSANPNWQNITEDALHSVADLIMVSRHMIGLAAIPAGTTSVTLDVVRSTPTYNDNDWIQIGREQLDAIVDYAEHLALFKVGGAEWHATERQAKTFLLQAITFNQRIAAAARAIVSAADQVNRQKAEVPRRLDSTGSGAGAVKGTPDGRR